MDKDLGPTKAGIIIGAVVLIVVLIYFFVGRQKADRSGPQFQIKVAARNGWVPGRPETLGARQPGHRGGAGLPVMVPAGKPKPGEPGAIPNQGAMQGPGQGTVQRQAF